MGRYARYAEENSRAVQHEPKSLTMKERRKVESLWRFLFSNLEEVVSFRYSKRESIILVTERDLRITQNLEIRLSR